MPITWTYPASGSPSSVFGPDNGLQGIAEFAINPLTGDMLLPPQIIHGAAAVAQRVRVRFKFFLGEWFLDQRLGVPYYQDILIKNPDPILISQIFKQVLLTTPGVLRIARFQATLDRVSRTLTVDFEAVLVDGSTILSASAEPFIIGA